MTTATLAACNVVELNGVVSGSQNVVGTHRVTGQYVYDLFFADQGEQTKMDFVRYAVDNIEVEAFKKALKDFVEIASKHSDAYKKTAQNHQTVMRLAYGAMRFVDGFRAANSKTGYQAMRVLAKDGLKQAGLKWDGSAAPTEVDAAVAQADKAQAAALAAIRKDNPQRADESPFEWENRVRGLLAANMAENSAYLAEIVASQEVEVLAAKVRKLCGDDLIAVLELLLNEENVTIG